MEAAGRSGFPLEVRLEEHGEFDSQVSLAHGDRHAHILTYTPEYSAYRDHFIVSAALKIIRLWEVPPEERYMPASEVGRRLPAEDEADLARKWKGLLPRDLLVGQLSAFLFAGMVRQLTSYPVDLRVEREIADRLTEHHPVQQAYLRRQVHDFEPTFLPEMAVASSERVHRASTAMNVAFAEEVAELTASRVGQHCQQTRYRTLGQTLRSDLRAVQEPGLKGDRIVVDTWGGKLGMRDWYEWRLLDDPAQ